MNANLHTRNLKPRSSRSIPLALSLLSAGETAEITDDHELLDINELITGGRDGFVAFVVTGESMVDAIRPGYIVFVDTYAEPRNGDIVVSNVNGLNNVKTFENGRRGLFLVPKNNQFPVRQITHQDQFCILGVVKAHLGMHDSVRADLVMNGDIRGNTRTHTFHVPGCPQYNSMNAENIRTFPTIGDAEDAQYDPSRNCLEDINLRRSIEDGDGEDGSPGGMEDPRQ